MTSSDDRRRVELPSEMRKLIAFDLFDDAERGDLERRLTETENAVARETRAGGHDVFGKLPANKRAVYREVIDLIYACSANPATVKALVDRILERL